MAVVRESPDARLRLLALTCGVELHGVRTVTESNLAGYEAPDEALEMLRKDLADPCPEHRERFLKVVLEHPIGRAFAVVAPLLADEHRPLRSLAAKCLKACATCDERTLAAVLPFFIYEGPSVGEQHEEEYIAVRRDAIRSVSFYHGSLGVQYHLLAAFTRSGLGIKKQLTNAFRFCPEPEELKQVMLRRAQDSDVENALSAWYVLANFEDPALRPRFHEVALSDDADKVYAGVRGLFPILSEEDRPVLEQVRNRWRPDSRRV